MENSQNIIESGVRSQESGVRSQESGKERDSSLELLRIVAMLMIVEAHFAQHGGFNFPSNEISINRLWQQLSVMHGQFGNDIFVLISGYFLVKSNKIKISKLFGLVSKALFYFAVMICFVIFMKNPISKSELLSLWWFVQIYFVLYLVHPYINVLLNNLSREEYKKMLLMLGLYWSLLPMLIIWSFAGSGLIYFIYIYSIGGYFNLHAKDFGNKKFILYGFLFIMLNLSMIIILDLLGLNATRIEERIMGMMSPVTLLGAMCMFIGFKKIPLKNNKLINLIASATLGVYLLHENILMRPFLWLKVFKNFSFQDSPYLIPYSIGVVILVFAACTLIEITRSKIFKLISRGRLS